MATHQKIKHWQSIIDSQCDSGLTIASFCKQHNINISTYYAWRKKLVGAAQEAKHNSQQLIPLFVNEPVAEQNSPLLLTTPGGFQLAFDESLPTKKLHHILRLLK